MKETTPDLTRISKYISLILRHKPEVIGIKLDTHGWADVNALLAGISRNTPSTGTSWRKSYRVMKSSGIPSARTGQKSGPTRATPSRWMWNSP